MKFKLDENLGNRGRALFADAGHDVETVRDEGLEGDVDRLLIQACANEARCLVTLDLDFANTVAFPPNEFAGICVLRLPRRYTPNQLFDLIKTLLVGLRNDDVRGRLWIVELGRIRIHRSSEEF